MIKAVAVGEKRFILGFKGVGFEIAVCNDGNELRLALGNLARDGEVALLLVTESLATEAPDALSAFRERSGAILTVIPTHEGSRYTSFQAMKRAIELSIGVDILGKE